MNDLTRFSTSANDSPFGGLVVKPRCQLSYFSRRAFERYSSARLAGERAIFSFYHAVILHELRAFWVMFENFFESVFGASEACVECRLYFFFFKRRAIILASFLPVCVNGASIKAVNLASRLNVV